MAKLTVPEAALRLVVAVALAVVVDATVIPPYSARKGCEYYVHGMHGWRL